MRKLVPVVLLSLVLAGCGGPNITPNPEPVALTGKISMDGKPVPDAKLNFQPVDGGLPAVVPVKDGEFSVSITPGKYTYFLSQGEKAKNFEDVPPQYLEGDLGRICEVSGDAGPLDLQLN